MRRTNSNAFPRLGVWDVQRIIPFSAFKAKNALA
jgi:hypothetical protein